MRGWARVGSRGALALFALGATVLCLPPPAALAQEATPFYAGKTLRIVIGTTSGGGFDTAGRILAQHIANTIPGHPTIVVENMPGGSSLRAANYIYNAAPGDGTYLGIFNHSLILQTIADPKAAQFAVEKFNWIGRMAIDDLVGIVWHATGVKTLEQAKSRQVIIGSDSASSSSAMVPLALNHLLGTKFKVVPGYPGIAERYLAMERREIDGIAGASWTYINETRPDWIKEQKIAVLHQNSLEKSAALPEVPTLVSLAQNADNRRILSLLGLTETVGKSIAFGPNVPPALIATLRRAFDEAVADPKFAGEAKARGLIPAPMAGEKLQVLFAETTAAMTPDFMEQFKRAIAP